MPHHEIISQLGGWEGYRVSALERFGEGKEEGRPEVWISLEPVVGRQRLCGECGDACGGWHDMTERWIRDLPVFGADTWLKIWRCRVWCVRCGGPKLEHVSWLAPYARVTTRLAESVARLCQKLALKHAAEYFALSWDQVKAIDKAYLAGC